MLTPAALSPGAASPAESLPGATGEPSSGGASPPSGGGAAPTTRGHSPALVPATARRGVAMRNNRISRSNIITRRAAVELIGAVNRYRGVRPNNNNNLAALVERFQPSTLHNLRQLSLYANTDTPNTAHQLDTVIAAEVVYTITTTQPSGSRGVELDCVPNTFTEAMGLPQTARWEA